MYIHKCIFVASKEDFGMPFGIPELLLIFAAMILLFGGKKNPELR